MSGEHVSVSQSHRASRNPFSPVTRTSRWYGGLEDAVEHGDSYHFRGNEEHEGPSIDPHASYLSRLWQGGVYTLQKIFTDALQAPAAVFGNPFGLFGSNKRVRTVPDIVRQINAGEKPWLPGQDEVFNRFLPSWMQP